MGCSSDFAACAGDGCAEEQKENFFLTAYAGRGMISNSGDGAGGDEGPPRAGPPPKIRALSRIAPNGRLPLRPAPSQTLVIRPFPATIASRHYALWAVSLANV